MVCNKNPLNSNMFYLSELNFVEKMLLQSSRMNKSKPNSNSIK